MAELIAAAPLAADAPACRRREAEDKEAEKQAKKAKVEYEKAWAVRSALGAVMGKAHLGCRVAEMHGWKLG